MPNINGQDQLNFCFNVVRPGASLLCQAYTSLKARLTQWNGLGAGAGALAVMTAAPFPIKTTADFLMAAGGVYDFCFRAEQLWFLKGTTTFIPNDAASPIMDGNGGSVQLQPLPLNGANVNIIVSQLISFRQWLQNNSFVTTGTAGNFANRNNILQVSSQGTVAPVLADGANFMSRAQDIVTQYEANTNNILNNLLVGAGAPSLIT